MKILLDNADKQYIPEKLFRKNKNGIYIHGVWMVAVIVGILIILPIFGIGGMNELVTWLVKINSVCMPLRYLWVFVAYISLKRLMRTEPRQVDYRLTKNPVWGEILGIWCFLLTAASCIMGIYSENTFEFVLNIVVPLCLIGLGFIMPQIARRTNPKA